MACGPGLCLVRTASKLSLKIRNYPDIIGELLARERTMVGNRTSGHLHTDDFYSVLNTKLRDVTHGFKVL